MKLLVFSSPTCGPCKMMAPLITAVAKEMGVEVIKFPEGHGLTFTLWDVTSVPTLILVNDKMVQIKRHTGMLPKPKLKEFLTGE